MLCQVATTKPSTAEACLRNLVGGDISKTTPEGLTLKKEVYRTQSMTNTKLVVSTSCSLRCVAINKLTSWSQLEQFMALLFNR